MCRVWGTLHCFVLTARARFRVLCVTWLDASLGVFWDVLFQQFCCIAGREHSGYYGCVFYLDMAVCTLTAPSLNHTLHCPVIHSSYFQVILNCEPGGGNLLTGAIPGACFDH